MGGTFDMFSQEHEIAALQAENARLRAALEWYADEFNYQREWHYHVPTTQPVVVDNGDRARAALKGSER